MIPRQRKPGQTGGDRWHELNKKTFFDSGGTVPPPPKKRRKPTGGGCAVFLPAVALAAATLGAVAIDVIAG